MTSQSTIGRIIHCCGAPAFALLALALLSAQAAHAQGPVLAQRISELEHKLAAARDGHQDQEVARDLDLLGELYREAGQIPTALNDLNQAVEIDRQQHNRAGEARSLNTIGRIYADTGREDEALELLNRILSVWRELHIPQGEASTLTNLGRAYNYLGRRDDALKVLNEALPLWREAHFQSGEASALTEIGLSYSDMGQDHEALRYYDQALPLWRGDVQLAGEALTLTYMAKSYTNLGEKQRAIESFHQAIDRWHKLGHKQGEADALTNLGVVYQQLAQYALAIEEFNESLPLWRDANNKAGEALALNEIGRTHMLTGRREEALEFYNRALPLWHESQNRRGEAATVNNIGRAIAGMNDPGKALEYDARSLAIWREVKDRRGESMALASMGVAYSQLGKPQEAEASELAALSLAKDTGDVDLQGNINSLLMYDYRRERRTEEAIFFGKAAVNALQQIRKNISGLDQQVQSVFTESHSGTFRTLAELLVQTDRLGEAEQVLDLLKVEELKEVVRGAAGNGETRVEQLKLSADQQAAQAALDGHSSSSASLVDMSAEFATLQAKSARTDPDTARMKTLETQIEAANADVSAFFRKTLYPDVAGKAGIQDANALVSKEKSEVSRLQNTLGDLGPQVMGIRLLMGDEHSYAIVITAQARKRFELKATPAELRAKVLEARELLRSPTSDPRPKLGELYTMLVGPFAGELAALEQTETEKNKVPTLLWSLDGALRYLPMAALYDGKHYMAERFNNVLFTLESYGHMGAAPAAGAQMQALAMGLSKSYGGLPALPGVLPELNAVVHDPTAPESHGPLEGRLLPDDQFTLAALKDNLGTGNGYAVVHIASHFVEQVGGGDEPYLMLSGESSGAAEGFALTLSRLEDSTISFHGTKLLTLSACSTAKGDAAKDGMEMDSLGMVAQQKDAEAVMATLWDVNDASTSKLMSDFYARWIKHPADGKAEALRQAQLAFLSVPAQGAAGTGERGFKNPASTSSTTPLPGYSHPFYWAPFVLIGNFR